jgi:uncharacterized DUF497 family protein
VEEVVLRWSQNTIDHIHGHGVTPEEVGEVIYDGKPFVRRGPGSGENRRYYVLGQTQAGRYLQIVLGRVRGTTFKVITARGMTDDERRLYRKKSS